MIAVLMISVLFLIPVFAQEAVEEQIAEEQIDLATAINYIQDQLRFVINQSGWQSYVSLILGLIAIIIAIFIFKIQNKQGTKIQNLVTSDNDLTNQMKNLTKEVHNVVTKEAETKQEIKEDVSFLLKKRLYLVSRGLEHSLNLYEKYKKELDLDKKKNFELSILNSFDRCQERLDLKFDLLKLMEIYGRAVARQYWELLTDLGVNSNLYFFGDDFEEEFLSFISHVAKCLGKTGKLKEIIEPMASATIKPQNTDSSQDNTQQDSELQS